MLTRILIYRTWAVGCTRAVARKVTFLVIFPSLRSKAVLNLSALLKVILVSFGFAALAVLCDC